MTNFTPMNLADYQTKAQQKHQEHQRFLKWLKQKKPKDLDAQCVEAHKQAFAQIDCLTCANCCKTTGPLFTERDIVRISAKLKLKPSEFEERYLWTDKDGDKVLQAVPCPFLQDDNRCNIYDFRPKACREFPHTDRRKFYQINHLTIKNTKICPAAFEVVEALKVAYQR